MCTVTKTYYKLAEGNREYNNNWPTLVRLLQTVIVHVYILPEVWVDIAGIQSSTEKIKPVCLWLILIVIHVLHVMPYMHKLIQ